TTNRRLCLTISIRLPLGIFFDDGIRANWMQRRCPKSTGCRPPPGAQPAASGVTPPTVRTLKQPPRARINVEYRALIAKRDPPGLSHQRVLLRVIVASALVI